MRSHTVACLRTRPKSQGDSCPPSAPAPPSVINGHLRMNFISPVWRKGVLYSRLEKQDEISYGRVLARAHERPRRFLPSIYPRAPLAQQSLSPVIVSRNVTARQEFFEDVRALFGSLAFRVQGDGINTVGGGRRGNPKDREVNLRTLLDQLQVMKAEPRNQLRYRLVSGRANKAFLDSWDKVVDNIPHPPGAVPA